MGDPPARSTQTIPSRVGRVVLTRREDTRHSWKRRVKDKYTLLPSSGFAPLWVAAPLTGVLATDCGWFHSLNVRNSGSKTTV